MIHRTRVVQPTEADMSVNPPSHLRREIVAGATTFATMAYVFVVNPMILSGAGMPFGPAMTATVLAAFIGTLLMGVYARRPFAVAPYMGENAFIAVTVVGVLGFTWQQALGAIFIGGVLFTLLTVTGARGWLTRAVPDSLKIAFAAGIGLFLAFVGMNSAGLVDLGGPGAPVRVAHLTATGPLLALCGILLMGWLVQRRVPGALLIGILAVAAAGFATGAASLPGKLVAAPPPLTPLLGQLDIVGALRWDFLPVILTVFILDFVDTMGTLLGLARRTDMLDAEGNLPEIEKPMLCDSVATMAGAVLGTTTTGTYLESAAGIEAGGRTGVASVVTALLFLSMLFLSPLFGAIPGFAYGPALVLVGAMMLQPLRDLDTDDMTEVLPAFLTMIMMAFTLNLGVGLTAGLAAWPLLKLLTGRAREVRPGMWVLGGASLLFFAIHPY